MRLQFLALLLPLAACAAEPDAPSPEGTANPLAETPVEAPAEAFTADSAAADTAAADSTAADTAAARR